MNHNIYSSLASSDVPWFCCDCGLPNFSDSFFDESRSSESTEGITENDTRDGFNISRTLEGQNKYPKCLLLNARSLRNQIFDLQVLLLSDSFDIVAITEIFG